VGCDSQLPENPNVHAEPQPAGTGSLDVVHAVTDAPPVDVYVDGKPAISGLEYRKLKKAAAPAGSNKVEIRPAGAADTTMPLWSSYVLVQRDQKVLLAAVGRIGDPSGATKFNVIAQPFGTPDPSAVHARLLHAAPGAPAVDLAAGDKPVWSAVGFGQLTETTSLGTGDVQKPMTLSVSPSGALLALGSVTLPGPYKAGSVYTAIAFGETSPLSGAKFLGVSLLNEQTEELTDLQFTINEQGPKASLYAFHAVPDAPAVDIYTKSGQLLAGNIAYQKASKLVELAAGEYQIEVRPAGMTTALLSGSLKLLADTHFVIYAAGLVKATTPAQTPSLYAAPRAQKGDGTQYRIVNAVSDSGTADLKNNGPTLFARQAYPLASAYRQEDLPAATLQLLLSSGTKKSWNIAIPSALAMSSKGEVVSLFLTGTASSMAQPLTAIAVVESSATAAQAPMITSLITTTP
jgi:hypothetical protein